MDTDKEERTRIISNALIAILLLWAVPLYVMYVIAVGQNRGNIIDVPLFKANQIGRLVYPILTVVLVVVALTRKPAARRFLRFLAAFALIVAFSANLYCAKAASDKTLVQTLAASVSKWSDTGHGTLAPLPSRLLGLYYAFPMWPKWVPLSDQNILAIVGVLSEEFFLCSVHPLFLLLMYLTPSFLAFPVFWLWVVLSALYVVLPEGAWGWMKDRVKLLRKSAFTSRS